MTSEGDSEDQNNFGSTHKGEENTGGNGEPAEQSKEAEDPNDKVRKAAEKGNAEAQYDLGNKYRKGEGVPEDVNQAVYWYRKAAYRGNVKAKHSLGLMYLIAGNDEQATYWLKQAGQQ